MPQRAGRAWTMVGLLSILYVFSYVDRQVLGLLVEPLEAELHIDDGQMALLIGTSFAFAYSVLSVPMGALADRLNRKWLVVIGGLLWTITTGLSAFATSFTTLLLLRLGVAVGEAALSPAALSIIADSFPREKRAFPTSVYGMSGSVGAAGSYALVALVMSLIAILHHPTLATWRLTLLAVAVPGTLFVLLFALVAREPRRTEIETATAETGGNWARDALAVVRDAPRFYGGMMGGIALMAIINMGTLVWYPTHLIRAYGFTAQKAGYWFGGTAALSAFIGTFVILLGANRLLARGLKDAPVRVAMIAVALGTPCILFGLTTHSPTLSIAAIFLGEAAMIGTANLPTLSIQLVTPNRQRALFIAVYFLAANLCGLGLAPFLTTRIATLAFGGSQGASLGAALAILCAAVLPVILGLLVLARLAFANLYERTVAAPFAGKVQA